MKCVRFTWNDLANPKIARLSDEEAAGYISTGHWKYCPKHEYKTLHGRDATLKDILDELPFKKLTPLKLRGSGRGEVSVL